MDEHIFDNLEDEFRLLDEYQSMFVCGFTEAFPSDYILAAVHFALGILNSSQQEICYPLPHDKWRGFSHCRDLGFLIGLTHQVYTKANI